ncbi:MAG: metallophosphoesterase family protein [Myxococcota bacterium]|nr:metallophosphoesterase family protein [Myxococcota bacterium]
MSLATEAEGPFEVVAVDDVRRNVHQVQVEGLEAGREYFFRIERGSEQLGLPKTYRFRSWREESQALRLVVLGDMQPSSLEAVFNVRRGLQAVRAERPELVVQLGDIVQRGDSAEHWDLLLSALDDVLVDWALGPFPQVFADVPLVTVLGNHDILGDGGKNWSSLFAGPSDADPRGRYFSHDLGLVRLIVLDAYEVEVGLSQSQLAWLDTQLASARDAAQWSLVFLHPSLLSTGTANMERELQALLVPRFARFGVHAVFFGHDHMYEHYEYTYGAMGLVHHPNDVPASRATHYFLSGGGGAPLEHEYGLCTRMPEESEYRWYDLEQRAWVTMQTWERPWNPELVNPSAPEVARAVAPAYCHDRLVEAYQSELDIYGHDYGENTMHYILVDISRDVLELSVHYFDGSLIVAPEGQRVQRWQLLR